ncbi:MAG: acyltransferase family protein [Akkermansia sp.]|nr:acyltransferase family protein [Akkermansia sp.]
MLNGTPLQPVSPKRPFQRNLWLDFYRIVFAVVIALYHETVFCNPIFPRGRLAVYFFFLLSGFLAAKSIKRHHVNNSKTKGCGGFIRNKLLAVQPELLVTTLFLTALKMWDSHIPCKLFPFFSLHGILSDVFLLRMTGIENAYGNAVAWYISSMILALVVLYPIIKRVSHVYLLFLGVALLGWIKISTGTLLPYYETPMSISFAGNFWAVGAMAIGASLSPFSEKLAGKFNRVSYHAACIVLLAFILYCIHRGFTGRECTPSIYDTLAIVAMCLMIGIAAIPKVQYETPSIIHRVIEFMGKLSLPFYLVHRCSIIILNHASAPLHKWEYLITYIALTAFLSVLVMIAASWIRGKVAKFLL